MTLEVIEVLVCIKRVSHIGLLTMQDTLFMLCFLLCKLNFNFLHNIRSSYIRLLRINVRASQPNRIVYPTRREEDRQFWL